MAAYLWLSIVLFLTPVLAETNEEEVGVANDYIDEVLNNLRVNQDIVKKIDPLRVPDINEKKIKGWDFWVKGLSSLHRSGDCTIGYDGDKIDVLGNVAVNNVRVEMNYKAKALFWISGRIEASLSRLAVKLRLFVNQETKSAHLEEFKVTEFGDIKVNKVTGLGVLLNWALKLIVQHIANKSRPKIVNSMETEVAKLLAKELAKVKIPIF